MMPQFNFSLVEKLPAVVQMNPRGSRAASSNRATFGAVARCFKASKTGDLHVCPRHRYRRQARKRANVGHQGPCCPLGRIQEGPAKDLSRHDAAAHRFWPAVDAAEIRATRRLPRSERRAQRWALVRAVHWIKSAHFCTTASAAPQGMIGTVEVEFFGEPSISLSE
jgi:hypothetical protein